MDRYKREIVETSQGAFLVGTWRGDGPTVLAVHGISSNHLLWTWVADAAPDLHLVAPDLRGRGGSLHDGPFGIEQHAQDMLAVMDALGLDRVLLTGMSLGGFVAVAMAARAPQRFSRVVLVDGGLPMPTPAAEPDELGAVVASRAAIGATYANVDDYVANYTAEFDEAFDRNDPRVLRFLAHNLDEVAGSVRVNLAGQAVADDAADVFGGAPVTEWLDAVEVPVHLIHARTTGYGDTADDWAAARDDRTELLVDGVDHLTIVAGDVGGRLVAASLAQPVSV